MTMMALQGMLLAGMVLISVMILKWHTLMASAVALGAFSLMMALEFYLLQAPDVAIAEAGIGAGLTTAILVVGIRAVRKAPEAPDNAAHDERAAAGESADAAPETGGSGAPSVAVPPEGGAE